MLANGSQVIGFYRGYLENGTVIAEAGTAETPCLFTIGDFSIPGSVSQAFATMNEGETRSIRVPYRKKGEKPTIAHFEVSLVNQVRLSALDDEQLHGEECACGCHKLRKALL